MKQVFSLTIYSFLILFVFALGSCASNVKETAHHHHQTCKEHCELNHIKGEMFERRCAYSVSEGDMHISGHEDFTLKYRDETYYFSSKEKLEKFKRNLKGNIKSAQKNWAAAAEGGFRR